MIIHKIQNFIEFENLDRFLHNLILREQIIKTCVQIGVSSTHKFRSLIPRTRTDQSGYIFF